MVKSRFRRAPPAVQRKDNPIQEVDAALLRKYVEELWHAKFERKPPTKSELTGKAGERENKRFEKERNEGAVGLEELCEAAKMARHYNDHKLWEDQDRNAQEGLYLEEREWIAYQIQRSRKFWNEPKDLLVTLLACCFASLTQGWDQVANGNLGWPTDFHLTLDRDGTGKDFWTVGGVNAITWFSAAIFGPLFVDPICQTRWFGRRGAVLIAAMFSFASMVGGSRATSWQGYLVARFFLGIGIGAKASVVPIWESEVLPPSKRGRLLVSWQLFTACRIFAGSVATYIFRSYWRNQVLSGAIPAFILMIIAYLACESPRWLILHGKHEKAFYALLRLRKVRLLALEELCYVHFQIQAERSTVYDQEHGEPTLDLSRKPLRYWQRVYGWMVIPRNQRASIATMVVMLSQQLSGINILGFVSSIFFSSSNLQKQPDDEAAIKHNSDKSLKFSIGFGVANAAFSAIAYFLIEPLGRENVMADTDQLHGSLLSETKQSEPGQPKKQQWNGWKLVQGRRALLICSLLGGSLVLFVLTFLLHLDPTNSAKEPLVMLFIVIWTFFYSPGAGAIPFVYSAEVWPNEGRDIGMSWAVCWNFLGAGFLALFVPRGLKWGDDKLFGLFTGLSLLGGILVYLLVPGTEHTVSLEVMSNRFDTRLRDFGEKRVRMLNPWRHKEDKAPETKDLDIKPQLPDDGNEEDGAEEIQIQPVQGGEGSGGHDLTGAESGEAASPNLDMAGQGTGTNPTHHQTQNTEDAVESTISQGDLGTHHPS